MQDEPAVLIDVNDEGEPIVTVGGVPVDNLPDLLTHAPYLKTEVKAGELADAANHLARGFSFSVIHDVADYRAAYLRQRNAENPDELPVAGAVRLSNYVLPNLDRIAPPRIENDKVVFFARHSYLQIPYHVEISADGSAHYEPV